MLIAIAQAINQAGIESLGNPKTLSQSNCPEKLKPKPIVITADTKCCKYPVFTNISIVAKPKPNNLVSGKGNSKTCAKILATTLNQAANSRRELPPQVATPVNAKGVINHSKLGIELL